MKRILVSAILVSLWGVLQSGCSPDTSEQTVEKTTQAAPVYKEIEWTDLMPQEDLDALMNPPAELLDIPDGSEMDQIAGQIQNSIAQANDDRYQQALTSTTVRSEFDGQYIKIPGFIVPIDFDEQQLIKRFFFVPYFGACIHVPPPPPNQIILVDYPQGVNVEELYDPFLVSGQLKTSLFEHQMATSAYALEAQTVEPYIEVPEQPQ